MKILQIISKLLQIEFVRFVIVGTIATLVHYGLYLLLIWCWASFFDESTLFDNIAYTLGYIISFFGNMWLTAHFTFREKLTIKRSGGFVVSHGINYGMHIAFLNLFLQIGIPNQWAPIPVYCIVVPINFLLVKFVFKSKWFQNKQ